MQSLISFSSNAERLLTAGDTSATKQPHGTRDKSVLACSTEAAHSLVSENSARRNSSTAQPQGRQKRWAPRTRTGCQICRERRIKCDECKPTCKRCTSTGRTCSGRGYGVGEPAVLVRGTTALQPALMALAQKTPTSIEMALSKYFYAQVVVVGWNEYDDDFWRRSIPQVANSLEPVWHACNALAAGLWLDAEKSNPRTQNLAAILSQESIRQHSASIRGILDLTQSRCLTLQDKVTILLVNFLYGICSLNRGEFETFVSLWLRSRALIRQWRLWECLRSPGAIPGLAAQLLLGNIRLECVFQASQMMNTDKPTLEWHQGLQSLQKRHERLMSTTEACIEMEMLWTSLQAILEGLPFRPSFEELREAHLLRHKYCHQFEKWKKRYSQLGAQLPPQDMHRVALDAQGILVHIQLTVDLGSPNHFRDETCWDEFKDDFDQAMLRLEAATCSTATMCLAATHRPRLASSLVKALHFTIKRCRDPAIRRKAHTMLQERLWDAFAQSMRPAQTSRDRSPGSYSFAPVIRAIRKLEEEAWRTCRESPRCYQGQYICDRHRVAKVYTDHKSQAVILCTVGDLIDGLPGSWVTG